MILLFCSTFLFCPLIFCLIFIFQVAWLVIVRNADYKPLQFLSFAFVYRLFEKLKSFERPVTPTYTVSHIAKHRLPFPFLFLTPYAGTYDKLYFESLIIYFVMQEDGEEVGKGLQMGKRLLRSLALVFGCIAVASLVYILV